MKKTMFLLTIIALGHACQTSSKLAIETYNEIKNENKLIEEFYGMVVVKRGFYYVYDHKKAVYLIKDFEINDNHNINFKEPLKIDNNTKEKIYRLLSFMKKHEIIESDGDYSDEFNKCIKFKIPENQILVYSESPSVFEKLKKIKSLNIINEKWAFYVEKSDH